MVRNRGNCARLMKTFLSANAPRLPFQKLNIASKEGPCGPVPGIDGQTYSLMLFSILYFNSDFNSCFQFSSCFMLYCFNFRYNVVFPIPNMRAAASLSPEVSRRVFKIARRSNSSKGRISLLSGTRSLVP